MTDFIKFCNKLSPLNQESVNDLLNNLKTKTYQKGDLLLKDGTVCKHLYFINQGLVKTFFYKKDKEFIMRFFPENVMFSILESYLTQTPSKFMIMALEPTIVTFIHQNDMEQLCTKHHCIETLFRKLLSIASLNMMKRISIMLEDNATERYNKFVTENNKLLQRISLGDLASYIGITQVSLSRIRAIK
ncbi:Crp/Fnr family transcriptional regulator [Parapedobacter tibetensis]|uniref:Crp/Fnr family transcriptional regulator n=1 Tax=Parapedobacter tibetensis TaxID=2972951 RepID=UPI00214D4FF6|nr:Crp/Fnr family transcriptional regulator [Parapedobacter tibetensis]